ncbi:guanine nucleotide exchange factor for Rab-3A-like isoform X1 [Ylistrum balloti]|uniref:guanine nucleotide exchange factor for Rab-3A-like isoform X1 n=1 Tax=Ylistrum balloti TaxID=509963 RepID=UPI002905EFF1|nr:guanine nucleotide exchange factor for Rab-3A-like isoform X1 [Ylistrum balloti]XP_060067727.1 guanine nucleotide exchange factor for Rab-3A-like isoform X1 [Ylistrum balloti]
MDTGQVVLQDPPKRAPPLGSPTHTAVTMTHINSTNGISQTPTRPYNCDHTTESAMFPMTAVIPSEPKRMVTINNNTEHDSTSKHQQESGFSPLIPGNQPILSAPGNPSVPSTQQSQSITKNGIVYDGQTKRPDNETTYINSDTTELRQANVRARGELRHAMSEVLPNEPVRRRSQTMANAKEHAFSRLQEELQKAQDELKLRDEECEKLLKVRDQMGEELEELTACLFEEANNMVQEANLKRMHSEKLLKEATEKIEVLEAEVVALKQLVLTSTPSSPNKHLHPQIDTLKPETNKKEKEKTSKPFWKTHRRSTSHHEFTREARQEVQAQQEAKNDRCSDIDPVFFEEFVMWRKNPRLSKDTNFLSRMYMEDISPCLNFANKQLSENVKDCVENNTLTIEPIPGDSSYPRRCCLTENNRLCNYKIKLGEDITWYSISQLCRNRIASVCDFYTYIRYINQGLVKSENKEAFYEISRLRKQMALARLGYS